MITIETHHLSYIKRTRSGIHRRVSHNFDTIMQRNEFYNSNKHKKTMFDWKFWTNKYKQL